MPGRKAEEMIPVVGRPRMERFPPTASYTPGERKTSESRGKRKTKKDKLPLMVCFYIFLLLLPEILPKCHLQAWLPRKLQHIEMYFFANHRERECADTVTGGGETGILHIMSNKTHHSMIFRHFLKKKTAGQWSMYPTPI